MSEQEWADTLLDLDEIKEHLLYVKARLERLEETLNAFER